MTASDLWPIAFGIVGTVASVLAFIYGVMKMKYTPEDTQGLGKFKEKIKYLSEKITSLFKKNETTEKAVIDLRERILLSENNIKHLTELQTATGKNIEKIYKSLDEIKNILMMRKGDLDGT